MKVLFYPGDHRNENHSEPKQMMLTRMAGHEIAKDINYFDVAFYLDFHTINVPAIHNAINSYCNDVSKANVDNQWHEIFGYKSEIDPLTYSGSFVVRKNVAQGIHDGRILTSRTKPVPGMFYNKLIDNKIGTVAYRDIRVVIIDGIKAIIIKDKSAANRFEQRIDCNFNLITPSIDDYLSEDEQGKINKFCANMGLDYGEIDCLRDRDKKLYCVDVNNIPGTRVQFIIPEMIEAFDKLLCKFAL